MLKNYACIYQGKIYRADDQKLSSLFFAYSEYEARFLPHIEIGDTISSSFQFYETNTHIKLKKYSGVLDKNETGDIEIFEVNKNIISLQKDRIKDMDFDEHKEELDQLKNIIINKEFGKYNYRGIEEEGYQNASNILNFLMYVMKERNPYLIDLINKDLVKGIEKNNKKNKSINFVSNILLNIFNATFYVAEGFEKLLKANPNVVYSSIGTSELNLNNKGKINKVIQLPKYVLEFVEKNNYQNLVPFLQELDIDGNSYSILIDFFNNSSVMVPSNKRAETFEDFLKQIVEIMEYDKYNISDLLSHLIKESFYHPCNLNRYGYHSNKKDGMFSFPLEEAKLLKDYLVMADNNGMKHKKYPHIILDHNVMMKNISSVEDIDDKEFKKAVDKYKDMVDNYKAEKYTILYPKDVMDMIHEGNALNHCVASYAFAILKGKSKIFFLREKGKESEPFVTVEVNEKNELNHIRQNHNIVPEQGIILSVNSWLAKHQ